MRVNISQNNIRSIDFDTVDQVIDFIKKFNSQETSNPITGPNINPWTDPYKTKQQGFWYNINYDIKIGDTVPDPNTVYCKNKTYTTSK